VIWGSHGYLLAPVNLAEVALALEDPALIQDHLAVALSSTWVECEMAGPGAL
jgi:hypothetical protein